MNNSSLFTLSLKIYFSLLILFVFSILALFRLSSFIMLLSLCVLIILIFRSFFLKPLLFKFYMFIGYVIYSIYISEYLYPEFYSVGFTLAKTYEIYFVLSLIVFIFSFSGLLVDFYTQSKKISKIASTGNNPVYFSIAILLFLIFTFGVDRSGELISYSVRISSFFEYSKLLFIFLFQYSNTKFKKAFSVSLLVIFVLQDLYYGGRITSFQLLIIFLFFNFNIYQSNFIFLFFFPVFIFIGILISQFRNSGFSFDNIDILSIFQRNPFLIFDTANYSFYASATHVFSKSLVQDTFFLLSFSSFLFAVFTGIDSDSSNLTLFVSKNFAPNLGGGLFLSEFYFWFDFLGIIIFSLLFFYSLYKLFSLSENKFFYIITISVVSFSPRWFLYGSLGLLRVSILIPAIIILLLNLTKGFNYGRIRK